jgi:hypothetical protein
MKSTPPVPLETVRYYAGKLWASTICFFLCVTAAALLSSLEVLLPILLPVLDALITESSPTPATSAEEDDMQARHNVAAANGDARWVRVGVLGPSV